MKVIALKTHIISNIMINKNDIMFAVKSKTNYFVYYINNYQEYTTLNYSIEEFDELFMELRIYLIIKNEITTMKNQDKLKKLEIIRDELFHKLDYAKDGKQLEDIKYFIRLNKENIIKLSKNKKN